VRKSDHGTLRHPEALVEACYAVERRLSLRNMLENYPLSWTQWTQIIAPMERMALNERQIMNRLAGADL
jgi:hypothetical protein